DESAPAKADQRVWTRRLQFAEFSHVAGHYFIHALAWVKGQATTIEPRASGYRIEGLIIGQVVGEAVEDSIERMDGDQRSNSATLLDRVSVGPRILIVRRDGERRGIRLVLVQQEFGQVSDRALSGAGMNE